MSIRIQEHDGFLYARRRDGKFKPTYRFRMPITNVKWSRVRRVVTRALERDDLAWRFLTPELCPVRTFSFKELVALVEVL